MDDVLAVLLAKQSITERLHDYARGIDRGDHALVCSAFHDDAPADYGAMYAGTGHGFADYVIETHRDDLWLAHRLSNITVTVDGDRAGSECYVAVRGRSKRGGAVVEMEAMGRYVDTWHRRDGEWRISGRRYLHGMDTHRVVEPGMFSTQGTRDASDPSRDVLGR